MKENTHPRRKNNPAPVIPWLFFLSNNQHRSQHCSLKRPKNKNTLSESFLIPLILVCTLLTSPAYAFKAKCQLSNNVSGQHLPLASLHFDGKYVRYRFLHRTFRFGFSGHPRSMLRFPGPSGTPFVMRRTGNNKFRIEKRVGSGKMYVNAYCKSF